MAFWTAVPALGLVSALASAATAQEYPADAPGWELGGNAIRLETFEGRPVIAGDMVAVGTERGLLYALKIADGTSYLRFQARGALSAAPAANQNAIYIADQSGSITAVDLASASVLWRYAAGAAISTSPLLADDKLLFGADDGKFYALDTRGGQQLAHIQLDGSIVSPPALGDGLVFVRADKIYALGS